MIHSFQTVLARAGCRDGDRRFGGLPERIDPREHVDCVVGPAP
ncbi:hypothetical protein RYH80_10615 [Halobaculum sp. MBLA0147]